VLGPEQAEHRELDAVGIAAELLADELELVVGEPELTVRGVRRRWQAQKYRVPARRLSGRPGWRDVGRFAVL